MIILSLFSLIIVVSGITCVVTFMNDKNDGTIPMCFLLIMLLSIIGFVVTVNTPDAIDVYRNKTTLKVTYEDSIPTDSVVIFKK